MQSDNFGIDSSQLYVRQILKIPLLSPEDVHCYAKQVQEMISLLDLRAELSESLIKEPTPAQWATKACLSEQALKVTLQKGQQAKRRLIEANLRHVVAIAKKFQKRGMDLQDLIQEGTIGLSRAVEKFDTTRGCKLNTYARWAIYRQMGRAASSQGEVANVSIKPEGHQGLQPISLNTNFVESRSKELLETLESEILQPEETVANLQRQELVRELVAKLTPRQQIVLTLLYGLKDDKQYSLTEAADKLGITRDQVRWAKATALKTMKASSPEAFYLIA